MIRPTFLLLLVLPLAACGGDTPDSGDEQALAPANQGTASPGTGAQGDGLSPQSNDPIADQRGEQQEYSRSRLIFETREIDLGMIFQRHDVPVEFPFRVEGPDPVTLIGAGSSDEFDVSCGCTDAYLRADWLAEGGSAEEGAEAPRWDLDQPIPAGAKATVIATFHGAMYNHRKAATITLRGNYRESPVLLDVSADIKPIYVSTPGTVMFGKVLAGSLRDEDPKVEVNVTAMKDFQIMRWKHLPSGVAVEEIGESRTLADGRAQKSFRFTLGQSAKVGALNGAAIAETSLGYDFEVILSGQVLGPVKFAPERRLMFGFWDAGEARTRTVRVDLQVPNRELPEPSATVVGDLAEFASVEIRTRIAGQAYDVAVTTSADTPPGSYSGVLDVEFPGESGFPSQQLTIKAIVREKAQ